MLLEALQKLRPCIGMTLSTEMLQRVCGGDAANLGTDTVARAARQALQESAAKRIANTSGIDKSMRRDRRHVSRRVPFDDRATLLAARHHERPAPLQDRVLVHAGLLANQFKFVIVRDDDYGARHAGARLLASHPRTLLSRIPDERNPERSTFIGVLQHGSRIVR